MSKFTFTIARKLIQTDRAITWSVQLQAVQSTVATYLWEAWRNDRKRH